jgi:hypothetical protein
MINGGKTKRLSDACYYFWGRYGNQKAKRQINRRVRAAAKRKLRNAK